MSKYTVKKIGWFDENHIQPMILLNKKQRDGLKITTKTPVKIIKGNKKVSVSTIAVVQVQFKEFANEQKSCSINKALAEKLELAEGDKIVIEPNLLESEHKQFVKDRTQQAFFGF